MLHARLPEGHVSSDPWAWVQGTLNGVREFPIIDGAVGKYKLTEDLIVGSTGTLTLASGVTLRTDNDQYDIFVDGRLESNGATIDLWYYTVYGGEWATVLDVRSGGELVMDGGAVQGPGPVRIRGGAQANFTSSSFNVHSGSGSAYTGSPKVIYYQGSTGKFDNASGLEWDLTIGSSSVLVSRTEVDTVNLSASATITDSTIRYVNLGGGIPTITGNTFSGIVPFRTTDPDHLRVGRITGNSYTAADPRVHVQGTLNGTLDLGVLDASVSEYRLTGHLTAAVGAELTIDSGVTVRVPPSWQVDISNLQSMENNGVIDLRAESSSSLSKLRIGVDTSLTGSGEVVMDTPEARIVGVTGATLTVGPNQVVRGPGQIQVDLVNHGVVQSDASGKTLTVTGTVGNEGTLVARSGGTLLLQGAVTNRGVVEAAGPNVGGYIPVVDVNNTLTTHDSGVLVGAVPGTVKINGDFLGNTVNTDRYVFGGNFKLDGSASAAGPHLLEAMSEDLGAVGPGFVDNFAYWELRLDNNNFVQVVDVSDNAAGTDPEAIYAHKLVVHAGSTLDLNGLNVYARTFRIDGAVVGGSIAQVPDGGNIELNRFISGSIAVAGEVDEWTFFGRAGQTVQLGLTARDSGSSPPLSPRLEYGQIHLLDSDGNVLAPGATPFTLAADGVYRVRVQAAEEHETATGNYYFAVWDVTTDVAPLVFGRQQFGTIESPFSEDLWTFSATENSQLYLDINETPGLSLGFTLNGPDGWVGLQDAETDSYLILPTTGEYVLTVNTLLWQYDIDYSFRVNLTQQIELTLGVPYQGSFGGSGHAQLFTFTVPEPVPVEVTLDDASSVNHNEFYLGLGSPPTRGQYDCRSKAMNNRADQHILLPMATAQTWYILLYADYVASPSNFTLLAAASNIVLSGVTPDHHGNSADAVLTLTGAGFAPSTTVELVAPDATTFAPALIERDSYTQLAATFAAGAVPGGLYSVRVTRADGSSSELANAFEMVEGGEAVLETNLVTPSTLGYHQLATIYIEYANTGDVAMPAPLLSFTVLQQIKDPPATVQSPLPPPPESYWTIVYVSAGNHLVPNYAHHPNPFPDYLSWLDYFRGYLDEYYRRDAILTLDASRVKDGFWTPAMPEGFSNSISFLADGETPGVLQPGETGRIPVYWAGWLKPWDFTYPEFAFSLVETTTTDTTPIAWDYWKELVRPETVSAQAWKPVWQNFVDQAGTTWGDYVSILNRNASYLGQLGQTTFDAKDLLALEVMQTGGALPGGFIEQPFDAALEAPGLSLTFGRAFPSDVLRRNELGPLGYGWRHSWQIHLEEAADGTVRVFYSGSVPRTFQPDVRGGYIREPGDLGTLKDLGGGAFSLREIDGLEYGFRSDGLLDYVQDTNGNRVTATYLGGRLVGLAHANGASLTLEYTSDGRIQKVADSSGNETVYGYDASGDHLVSATGPWGTTQYQYTPDTTGAQAHALTEIEYPGELHAFFAYDGYGRLERFWRDEGVGETLLAYAPAGEVRVTEQGSGQPAMTRLFFDHRNRLAKVEDPLGRTVGVRYDGKGNATSLELPDGTQYLYQYDARGNLTRQTDPLGQIGLSFTSTFNQLASVTDARGNGLLYDYDPATGNFTSITYQDGTSEYYTYASNGTLATWTNRRGQTISYERDYYTDGRLKELRRLLPDGRELIYSYSYDANGDSVVVTDETGAHAGSMVFNHDTGWIERVDYPGGYWLEYEYYDSGLRKQMMDQDGNITNYTYDAAGRLDRLTDGDGTPIVDYDYEVNGRLTRETLGNGVYTDYGYDLASQLEHLLTCAPDGSVISRFDYTYDDLGQRTSMATLDGTWSYEYDATGQLVHATFDSENPDIPDQDLQYVYDAVGNRIKTVANGTIAEYVIDNMNRYLQVGGKELDYDDDGSLTLERDGNDIKTLQYDALNRLVEVVNSTGTWEYEYGAFGNRTAVVHNGQRTQYLVDPAGLADVVAEYDANGTLTMRYVQGLELAARFDETGAVAYYSSDALGSVAAMTLADGSRANAYVYDPFGKVLARSEEVTNAFAFGGALGITEESHGLSYVRARYYSPEIGRFTSEDPIGLSGGDVNLYRFVQNSPVNFVDPAGHQSRTPKQSIKDAQKLWSKFKKGLKNPKRLVTEEAGKLIGKTLLKDALNRRLAAHPGEDALFDYFGLPSPNDPPPDAPPWLPPRTTPAPPEWFDDDGAGAGSGDPNQKSGPGWGVAGYVVGDGLLSYRVDFENDPTATAPAQFVLITDQLDRNLDWTTFELKEIGFGDELIAIPVSSQYYETVVPMTYNDQSFEVHVSAGIDLPTGEIRVMFMSLDPDTGLPPDVLTGFLPPEDGTGRGQGYVSYTIEADPGLPTGTEIRNVALIQFDFGEIIGTNQVDPHDPSQGMDPAKEALVTIDAAPPSSAVGLLPPTVPAGDFLVTWSGEDDAGGSGIKQYAIYLSTDGGPFELLLDQVTLTSMIFPGEAGHTYAFYTIATDNVGHVETAPSFPDAETFTAATVVGRHIFYNQSYFDGNNAAANANDDNAIAPTPDHASDPALGKTALLPGQTATFQNYTNYSRGINGIMVDIEGLADPDNLDATDFTFRVGNNNDPAGWAEVTAGAAVSVRPHPTEADTSRITITWPDNAIAEQWLQVTVLATDHTGLAENDVFYWGNAVGDSGEGNTSTFAFVTVTDELAARHNPHNLLDPAGIDDFCDYNRDRWVTVNDELIARHNATNFLNALKLITVPGSFGGSAGLVAGDFSTASPEEAVLVSVSPAVKPLIVTVPGPVPASPHDSPAFPTPTSTNAVSPAVLAAYDTVLQDRFAPKSGSSRLAANLPGGIWLPAPLFGETPETEDDDSAVDEALADDWLYDWPSL
jgi:RHS repeat-associated protein